MSYSEDKIIYLLKYREKLKETYELREQRLLKDLESVAETIEGFSLKSRELKEFIISKTNMQADPLFNTLEGVAKERKQMVYEQIEGLKEIVKLKTELETLLDELELLDEPYKTILHKFYIDGCLWKEIITETGQSQATCSRQRKKGLKLLTESLEKAMQVKMAS